MEPSYPATPTDVDGMAAHGADGDGPGSENASGAGAEIPGESHVASDEANGQEILFFGVDLLANEEEQSDLAGVVRDETEFQFKVVADERRRGQA